MSKNLERRMECWIRYGEPHFSLAVIGFKGAFQFYFAVRMGFKVEPSYLMEGFHPLLPMGVEKHSRSGEGEPHHTDCQFTGGNCWHDGSSLYAREHVMPLFLAGGSKAVFELLEDRYREVFGESV